MQPSQTVINYIASTEGFSAHPYLDPPHNTQGKYSTGYGHQIQPNEQYLMSKVLTQADALAMLQKDLGYYQNQINPLFKRTPTQGVYDGIFDLAYNAGPGAAAKVIATWNTTGDTLATANHAKLYNESGGKINPNLVARRQHDANLIQGFIASVEALAKKKAAGS